MRIIDSLFRRNKYVNRSNNNVPVVDDFGGARTSVPKFTQSGNVVFGSLPKRVKRDLGLDERNLNTYTIEDLMDILIDAHPDLSFALWNFLRIGNSGYTYSVKKLNGKRWPQGEKIIQEIIDMLEFPNTERFEKSRSLNKVINQLMLSVITRGAASLELVLTSGLNDVAFLAVVDPATIDFKFENNRYVPYQDDGKISLDIPTFFYEGLDELMDDPYGRSPFLSALNIIMFQLQVLNDLKAVVHNQGYPRFDIKVLEEILLKRMPIHIRNNEQEKQKWLNERLQEIIDMYNSLEPDDTFVHYDSIEIGMVGGGKSGGAMIDPEKLMGAIDNLIMSGLKTLSTILGRRSTGNTESFAKMEIKLYLQGVKAVQEIVERVLSRAFTLALNIKGKQGIVEFKFNPVEIRTELEQEQMRQIKLINIITMRDQGWIDQDEAAMLAVGHAPVAESPINNTIPSNKNGEVPRGTPDTNPNAGGNTDISNSN